MLQSFTHRNKKKYRAGFHSFLLRPYPAAFSTSPPLSWYRSSSPSLSLFWSKVTINFVCFSFTFWVFSLKGTRKRERTGSKCTDISPFIMDQAWGMGALDREDREQGNVIWGWAEGARKKSRRVCKKEDETKPEKKVNLNYKRILSFLAAISLSFSGAVKRRRLIKKQFLWHPRQTLSPARESKRERREREKLNADEVCWSH